MPDDPTPTPVSQLKESETSFGTFYPKNYVLAVFPDDATAARAGDALRGAGFAGDDVIVASGAQVLAHDATLNENEGWFTRLREQWAKLYTDASAGTQRLLEMARAGSAFVLAYAPEDDQQTRAADALRPLDPQWMLHYGAFTVTDLR